MPFKNLPESERPHVTVVPSANLEAIEPDFNERHEASNQPSVVLRLKTTIQDAPSNRIILDV